jgi:nucleoid-associated protein YgaU
MPAAPRVGWVRLQSFDPPLTVLCRLGDERPDVTSGYGGWDEVTRPRRAPITTYRAPTPLHLSLSLLIDRWAESASVEAQIATVEKMARPTGVNRAPPRLRVAATGQHVPHTERSWVIGELTWGDALMNQHGNRTRQQLSVVLYEFVEDTYMTEKSAARRRRMKAASHRAGAPAKRLHAKRKHHVVTSKTRATSSAFGEGEDLLAIAARELGDADRWVELAELNGLRDPRAITPGQVIRLP